MYIWPCTWETILGVSQSHQARGIGAQWPDTEGNAGGKCVIPKLNGRVIGLTVLFLGEGREFLVSSPCFFGKT